MWGFGVRLSLFTARSVRFAAPEGKGEKFPKLISQTTRLPPFGTLHSKLDWIGPVSNPAESCYKELATMYAFFFLMVLSLVLQVGMYIELNKMRSFMEDDHPQKKS